MDLRQNAGGARALRSRGRRADARGRRGRAVAPCPAGDRGLTVYLVGAGPGDPGLLTARALELIGSADVILYDRFMAAPALEQARADAVLIYVGKTLLVQEVIDGWLPEIGCLGL